MGKSPYEILGVEKSADAITLKRAYYTLVKKYPPEKFPAEFKELRSAYETLSDPARRAEYDGAAELPGDAAYLLEQAKELRRTGRLAQAVEVYEKLLRLYPDLLQAQVALALAYEAQDKKGKAIKLWESVRVKEPGNAEYALELALGYEYRGWNKKALAEYRRALELDGGDARCWLAYIRFSMHEKYGAGHMAKLAGQAVEALRAHGRESFSVYCYQAIFLLGQDVGSPEIPIRRMLDMLQRGQVEQRENPGEAVETLLDSAMSADKLPLLEPLMQMAECVSGQSDGLRESLNLAAKTLQIEALADEGYHAVFRDLFATLMGGCDSEDDKNDLIAMECHILYGAKIFNPQIQRLKTEKPLLYAMYADFFNEALRTREPQKLMYSRVKALSKKGVAPSFFEEEEAAPVETVRREGPKIGRNDPCPCGSGKKYKKCCGQ